MHARCRVLFLLVFAIILTGLRGSDGCCAEPVTGSAWPTEPVRTGLYLPPPRKVALSIGINGAYIPQIGDLAAGETYVIGGELGWNFAFLSRLGLFGTHQVETMGYANVALLNSGNEIGARFLAHPRVSIEAAYLSHRVEITWIDGMKLYPGGVLDHGAEIGTTGRLEWLEHIRLDGHVFGRYFAVYTEDHFVLGWGMTLSLMPLDSHVLQLGVEFLEVWRENARPGVEHFTHNTIGRLRWQSQLTGHVGISAAFEFSANLKVGEVPMLELKRSMIGEPMAFGSLGAFFNF